MNNWLVGEKFLAQQDKILCDLIKKYGHCDLRPLEEQEFFSTLLKGIISQQLSQQAAASIYGRVQSFYQHKPTPEAIYATEVEKLRELGLSPQKVVYVQDFSKHIVEGKVVLAEFSGMTDAQIMEVLLPIKGFGRWTVEMFLIFALNRSNILPVDDFGIKKAMNMLYQVDMKARRTVYLERAKAWEPWRTLATWYLWRYYSENK